MKLHRGVTALLKQAGATFVRRSKHYIFALPNGKKLTIAGTPSDRYAVTNQIREIKQAGGLVEEKKKNPDRVEKQGRVDAQGRKVTRDWLATDLEKVPGATPMAAQLSASGLAEKALRRELADVREQLRWKCLVVTAQEERISILKKWKCPCWTCRIQRYWKRSPSAEEKKK